MKKNKQANQQSSFFANHKLVTRRDFIAQGAIKGGAVAMTPSILGFLLRSEQARAAANCEVAASGMMPAVLIFDHAGGAGLLGQTVPMALGDQPLEAGAYASLGMPAVKAPVASIGSVIDNSWGINFHKDLSFVNELNTVALPNVKALVNSFNTIAVLGDDTSNNMTNPAAGLATLGAIGDSDRRLAPVLGTSASTSGGNSASSIGSPLFSSTRISSSTAAANLVSTGQLAARLGNNKDNAAKVMSAMQRMSSGQLARFSAQDLPTQAAQLVECGYVKGSAMAGNPQPGVPSLDVANAGLPSQIFNMTNVNSTESLTATLTYMLAMGFSGVGTVTLGGRDYHNGTRTEGEGKDREAANLTAKALNLYHRLITEAGARSRPLMIIHITDGGVSANSTPDGGANGFFQWVSDRGTANSAYVFMYDPAGKPSLARRQLGYSNAKDGGTDTKVGAATGFSNNAAALSQVFMINYQQLAGKNPADASKVFSGTVLSASDVAKYAITAKKGA